MKRSALVLYGSLAFFTTIVHNTFLLYHIDYYLSVIRIDLWSFWAIELIFLVWNSLNDPLFGWISDKSLLQSASQGSHSRSVVVRRISALSWAYPLLSVSFLLFWIPLPSQLAALQLVAALCLYDTALTTIELHYNGLLVDLTTSTSDRADLNFYTALFACFGASTVFISYTVWDAANPTNFRCFCALISAVSFIGFVMIIGRLKKVLSVKNEDIEIEQFYGGKSTSSSPSPFAFLKQLSKNPNFFWFSGMNLIQVLHCHFNSCFFPLILDTLLKASKNALLGSALLAFSFIAPHLNNLYLTYLCKHHGTYLVVRTLFYLKLIFPILLILCGTDCFILLVAFVACNRIFTEGLCKVLNLVMSELVDEDCVLSRRPHPVAALISGTVSLVTKPGQTLAPIIGTALISYLSSGFVRQETTATTAVSLDSSSHAQVAAMSPQAIFHTIVWVPIACAGLQILIWTQYRLRGNRLKMVQHLRNAKSDPNFSSFSSLTYLPL